MKKVPAEADIIRYGRRKLYMRQNIINVMTAIDYIEKHLTEKLDLDIIADAVHYSKYHLHRVFTNTVGLTIHDYVHRRQLTEAAKLLVFSGRTIIDIALISGYESQQAFTTVFKAMYKKTPRQYREAEQFYPLQLRYILNAEPTKTDTEIDWEKDILFAASSDIPAWMALVRLCIDGFPCLNENEYSEQLKVHIKNRQALMIKDGETAIGTMIFNRETGSIDFLGIHPQYRKHKIAGAFLQKMLREVIQDTVISITTFREGDKADTGYRNILKRLGFAEAELLTEFGYPTQRFILHKEHPEASDHE